MLAGQVELERVANMAGSIQEHPVLDVAHLRRYTLGDEGLEREILGLFKEQVIISLANLKASNTSGDSAGWRLAAHTLKGSARGVGAVRLGLAAELAEINGDTPSGQAQSIDNVADAAAATLAAIG
ncbi:MAG: Hpt domain-containing protein [Alphaproteobacteria bacterium]|nr:Hpt domain-containing protein [Alphaproteobacteria bacterium]